MAVLVDELEKAHAARNPTIVSYLESPRVLKERESGTVSGSDSSFALAAAQLQTDSNNRIASLMARVSKLEHITEEALADVTPEFLASLQAAVMYYIGLGNNPSDPTTRAGRLQSVVDRLCKKYPRAPTEAGPATAAGTGALAGNTGGGGGGASASGASGGERCAVWAPRVLFQVCKSRGAPEGRSDHRVVGHNRGGGSDARTRACCSPRRCAVCEH